MSSQSVSPAARLVRGVFHGRNPLTRPSDRVEAAVAVLALLITLLSVPFAAALGSDVYAEQSVVSAEQTRTRHQAVATLLEDSEPGMATAATGSEVLAAWRAPDGTPRRGTVTAPHDLKAGTGIQLWVDDHGTPTTPPLTSEGAVITAIGSAVTAWLGLVCVLWAAHALTVCVGRRRNVSKWEREWAVVGPEWTRRRR